MVGKYTITVCGIINNVWILIFFIIQDHGESFSLYSTMFYPSNMRVICKLFMNCEMNSNKVMFSDENL